MKRLRGRTVWALVVWAIAMGAARPVLSQSVVEIYQRQHFRKQALELIQRHGGRIDPRGPAHLATSVDSFFVPTENVAAAVDTSPKSPAVTIRTVQRIPRLALGFFRRRFEGQKWVFLGANSISPLDTMMTRDIRARLEAHFGKPTRTLVDFDPIASVAAGNIFEFEYCFLLDDEIPLVVTDVNGPFERGVAASTTEPYGDVLLQLRDSLLRPMLESERRAPFVDYYYDDELVQWYRTGFDGRLYFLDPVDRPGLHRPVLTPYSD